jgi:hypothetical protein
MKTISVLGLLVFVCCFAAGCASGKKKIVPLSFTTPVTTTVAAVETGQTIRCGAVGAQVPARGQGVRGFADGVTSSSAIQLSKRNDGPVVVKCAGSGQATQPRPTAASNERKGELAARQLIAAFKRPPGAARLKEEPHGDQGFLRHQTFAIGGQSVMRHAFWQVDRGLDSVVAFVKSHPPQFSGHQEGGGQSLGAGVPKNRSIDFVMPDARGHPSQRWMEVTMAALLNGSTGIRVDVAAEWLLPRPRSEMVPAGVREIDIQGKHLSRRVTQPAKVQKIIRWFDALDIVQGGPAHSCPAVIDRGEVVIDFRSAQRVLLAQARFNAAGALTDCNPIAFSIHGRMQTPLIGLTFWNRVKRLVGIASR